MLTKQKQNKTKKKEREEEEGKTPCFCCQQAKASVLQLENSVRLRQSVTQCCDAGVGLTGLGA